MKKVAMLFLVLTAVLALMSCTKNNGNETVARQDQAATAETEQTTTIESGQGKDRDTTESSALIERIKTSDTFTDRPLEGLWYYEFSEGMYTQREEIRFNADKSFTMVSSLTDGVNTETKTTEGFYEQEYNYVTFYFVESQEVVYSVWMMVFMRQHEDHKNLYLMMEDGAFVYYRMDVKGEPEPAPVPEGLYWNTYCWEADRELYMTLDFDRCEVTMLYKNVESSEPYKIVPFYVIGDCMYWADGYYRLEGFREGPVEYLFASDGPNHSTAWKEIDNPAKTIQDAFPDVDLSEILELEPEYHQ